MLPILGVIGVMVALVVGATLASFLGVWLQAQASGVRVSLLDLVFMRLRGIEPRLAVGCMTALLKAGIRVPLCEIEAHVLAGGNLAAVTDALISASKAALRVDFRGLAAIDLAGCDVVAAVRAHVNPLVLTCPPPGSGADAVTGVCQDGVRLGARARVTVRTDLQRLVGGAGELTVLARVGEGIVAAIGRSPTHKQILQSPERISEHLLAHGLDSGTCYEILSVDIAHVDVLDNVGARLQSAQALTDTQVAQAQAEIRRAAAVAAQQEMCAYTMAMQRNVVSSRSQVPAAAAAGLREGNLGRRRPLPATTDQRVLWRPAAR